MNLEFKKKSRRELLKTPIFTLQEDISAHPVTGVDGKYVVIDAPNWVNMVALTDKNEVLMVRQWRHGTECVELELPAGQVEPDEDPVEAAKRELREETGYVSKKTTLIGEVKPNCAFLNNSCFTVLLEGCTQEGETAFDAGEQIALDLVPMADVPKKLRDGSLRSGMMVAALLWYLDSQERITWR